MATQDYAVNKIDTAGYSSEGTKDSEPVKPSWGSPLEFILACLGYAVGLGNVWRFPYLAYRNGGGAFLIPFFLMMIFIGIPIFFLELIIGQYTGLGPLQAFSAIGPFFSGVGYCTLVIITIISIYYMIVVSWTLFYTIVSIAGSLDWGSCENLEYNSVCNPVASTMITHDDTEDADTSILGQKKKQHGKIGDLKLEHTTGSSYIAVREDGFHLATAWNPVVQLCKKPATHMKQLRADTVSVVCRQGNNRLLIDKDCYSGSYDQACRENNNGTFEDLTYYMRNCTTIGEICTLTGFGPLNSTHCANGTEAVPWSTNVTRIMASEEYFNERVLGRGDATWENWGSIQWHIVGCLFLSWVIAFFVVIKGIQSAGKVVYFTSLFPYLMLTVLLIRGVTLEGAGDGISFYLTPDWGVLLEARVWGDAASQIFYSFGVACGSLVTLASYNNFHNNCHFDAIFVSFANFLTSVYAGFAIFSVLGFSAKQMGVSVDDVAEQGHGLAFVAYPEALLQMPVPRLWCILFFFMLFILGLGSQFAGIEAINTAIVDQWPQLRKRYWMVTAMTCFSCFILGLPMCFSGGVYLFTMLDWNTASWAILLVGLAECVSISWCYGLDRIMNDLASMNMKLNKVFQWYWKIVWAAILPLASVGVLIFIFYDWAPPSYEGYEFPLFADLLGWAVGLSTLMFFPVGVGWAWYKGYRGKALFQPTEAWKPAYKSVAENRSNSVMTIDSVPTGPYDNIGYVM